MQVFRVISAMEPVLSHRPRRLESARGRTRCSWRSGRGCRTLSTERVPRVYRRARPAPVLLRSSESEKQTAVDEGETENQVEEEGEGDDEVVEVTDETYSGPGSEILKKLAESDSDLVSDLAPEMQQALESLLSEKSEAEERYVAAESELEETKSKFLRLNADFDNFRKRAESERDQLRTSTKGDVIESLLPLIDNFELARTQIKPQNESEEAIVTSFMGIYRQMVELFNQLGVEGIDCVEKPFDPEFHDAMVRELNNDLPEGTVIEEMRKGFTLNGKLVRPAMVKVSYSDEVLQDTELPMEEPKSTVELDKEDDADESTDKSE